MEKTKLKPIIIDRAVDLYAFTPNIKHCDVAKELGINEKTLRKLRKDSNFWERVYTTFMQSFEGELPDILRSMCREAKAGNVMASRLVLEHSGKLQKNINITIQSPFEKWLATQTNHIQEAEVVIDELPSTNTTKKPFNGINKELQKKQDWNTRRRELHQWKQRAKKVGIKPLPARRPTPGQRKEWEESIERLERGIGG